MKRNIHLYIRDILESIDCIGEYANEFSREQLIEDKKTQDAVLRRLEIMGEASKNIPSTIKKKYPQIPWKEMAGTRDVLTHAYFSVNSERIWNIIKNNLPNLRVEIKKILDEIK